MKLQKLFNYAVVLVAGVAIGAGLMYTKLNSQISSQTADSKLQTYIISEDVVYSEYQSEAIYREIQNEDGTKLIIKAKEHPAMITITFAEPIAPDFFVGCGVIGGHYEMFADDPEYDPLGIGVDYAVELTNRIRQEVPGVTEDIYAEGYELEMHIADSHVDRLEEIIDEVLEIINEHNSTPQDAQDPQGDPVLQDSIQSDPL